MLRRLCSLTVVGCAFSTLGGTQSRVTYVGSLHLAAMQEMLTLLVLKKGLSQHY